MISKLTGTIVFVILSVVALGTILFTVLKSERKNEQFSMTAVQKNIIPKNISSNQIKNMKITSPAFENNESIPAKYTCDGENINPTLAFSDIPSEAKSLALIMDDPDAPAAGGFVHWVLFNITPDIIGIAENSTPANSVQGQNSSGQSRYIGPCPPSGTHHYHFKLYALDKLLNLTSSATREDVQKAMQGHILDQAELIGIYKRI